MATDIVVTNQTLAEQSSAPGNWVVTHAPGANAQATITKAAPAAGKQHVVTAVCARLVAGGTAPTAVEKLAHLIAGASGGTAVASFEFALPATAGASCTLELHGLNIEIAEATAATLEFAAAAGANTFESVVLAGYTQNVVS